MPGASILICHSQNTSLELEQVLTSAGFSCTSLPVTIVQGQIESTAVRQAISRLSKFDWLVVGSPNGVRFFKDALDAYGIPVEKLRHLKTGTVGKKTAGRLREVFPFIPDILLGENLQDLLGKIAASSIKDTTILNPTSEQSLANIPVELPPQIRLERVPFYRSETNHRLKPDFLMQLRETKFDIVFFSSPSSFNAFREIAGDILLNSDAAVGVMGTTTARHIKEKGFPVAILPKHADAVAIQEEITKYLKTEKQ